MPDGGIHALSGLRSYLRAPPQDRQAQRRRAVRLHTCDSAGWRHTCLIRPTFLPAGSPPQDRQAQRRRAVRRRTCDSVGWRHKCLIRPTFLPAGSPPRTGKRSAAGQLVQANSLSSPSGAGPDPAGRDRNSSAPAGSDPDTRPDSA